MKYNIIVIISDTFRHDILGGTFNGYTLTPELNKFQKRAVSFDNFYTASFPTIPHRIDMVTGRYRCVYGGWKPLPEDENHIGELLFPHGYVSQIISDCTHIFKMNVHRGFTSYYWNRGQENDVYLTRLNEEIPEYIPDAKARVLARRFGATPGNISHWLNSRFHYVDEFSYESTTKIACRWIEDNYKHSPFMLWLDLFDPHEPWDAAEFIVNKFDPDYNGTPMWQPNYGPSSAYTSDELKNLRAHYLAEAHLVDRNLGKVLQRIEDTGLFENSIVLFTSDHGMYIGEHERTGKSNLMKETDTRRWPLYEEAGHVPFMIAAPELEGGKTVPAFGQAPDVLPTILDLVGLKPDLRQPVQGRSLAPFLNGNHEEGDNSIAVSSYDLNNTEESYGIITQEWKYFPSGENGTPELYNRSRDPLDTENVYEENREAAHAIETSFTQWLESKNASKETIQSAIRQFPENS